MHRRLAKLNRSCLHWVGAGGLSRQIAYPCLLLSSEDFLPLGKPFTAQLRSAVLARAFHVSRHSPCPPIYLHPGMYHPRHPHVPPPRPSCLCPPPRPHTCTQAHQGEANGPGAAAAAAGTAEAAGEGGGMRGHPLVEELAGNSWQTSCEALQADVRDCCVLGGVLTLHLGFLLCFALA